MVAHASLFADENVHRGLADALRALGHDVLTAHQAGRANKRIPDADQLAYATSLARAMLTNNRRHFHQLHRGPLSHAGIITYTRDPDTASLAQRIHDAVVQTGNLQGQLIRIVRRRN
jgi:Domain of unknown function (DUF5615)